MLGRIAAVAATGMLALAGSASAAITPGVQTYTDGGQCTANFVFEGAGDVYIGQAAHCAGTDGNTATNGCDAGSLPLGTPVEVGGATRPGTLAYSSWLTMQGNGEDDADTCEFNDFALVRLDPADHDLVDPSVPFWGGPTGIDSDGTKAGDRVWTYGNSSLRAGVTQLSPHTGISLGDDAADGGWSHPLYTVSPGIPGDSGSAFVSADGKAIGVLSTLGLAPLPLSNNIGDLGKELAFAQQHSGIAGLQLVNGTEAFDPIL